MKLKKECKWSKIGEAFHHHRRVCNYTKRSLKKKGIKRRPDVRRSHTHTNTELTWVTSATTFPSTDDEAVRESTTSTTVRGAR